MQEVNWSYWIRPKFISISPHHLVNLAHTIVLTISDDAGWTRAGKNSKFKIQCCVFAVDFKSNAYNEYSTNDKSNLARITHSKHAHGHNKEEILWPHLLNLIISVLVLISTNLVVLQLQVTTVESCNHLWCQLHFEYWPSQSNSPQSISIT